MARLIGLISLMMGVLVIACSMIAQTGEAGLLDKFFESGRVTRCPVPGVEREIASEKITIKTMNFPKEPCMERCKEEAMESMVGQEQAAFGPKVYCCCKPAAAAAKE